MTGFQWTRQKRRAAEVIAEGGTPDRVLAAELGVGRTTIASWKRRPEFRERVNEILAAYAQAWTQ